MAEVQAPRRVHGPDPKQVQRIAVSLESVGLLRRERRDATSNRFHLDGTLTALEKLITEGEARK